MPNIPIQVIFAVIAVIFGVLAARDYTGNGRNFSVGGKIRFRMALIFAVVSAYLFLSK